MIKLVFTLRRRQDVSAEEFHRYWRENHGPLVRSYAELFRLRRYVQTHLIDTPLNEQLAVLRNSQPSFYDGVAELWWDSADDIVAALSSDEGQAAIQVLLDDEATFIDLANSPLWMGEEHAVVG